MRPDSVLLEINPTSGVTAGDVMARDTNAIRRSILSSGFSLFVNRYDPLTLAQTQSIAWLTVDGNEHYDSMTQAYIQSFINGDNHLHDHRTFDCPMHPR